MITARQITATMRGLLPGVQPLTTTTHTSRNGLVLGYEITLPLPAARRIGAARFSETSWLADYLTRHLGTEVHIADVFATRRRDYSKLVHLTVKTGPRDA
jgi:hypothetical protein